METGRGFVGEVTQGNKPSKGQAMLPQVCIAAVVVCLGVIAAEPQGTGKPQQPAPSNQPASSPQERAAAIKKSLAQSQAKLKQYEWMETTTVLLKDEEKSRTVKRCYYGAEGKVQKVTVEAPPPESPGRGLRGKIKESKKQEMADYMKDAVELVKEYVPPDPERIQAVTAGGRTSVKIVEPGKRVKVVFADYFKAGDSLGVEVDIKDNRLLGVEVSTFLDRSVEPGKPPEDPVVMKVKESTFEDGTVYTERVELDAASKNLKVVVENSGYRKIGPASPPGP